MKFLRQSHLKKTINLFFISSTCLLQAEANAGKWVEIYLPEEKIIELSIAAGTSENASPFALYAISKLESNHNMYAYNPSNKNGTADMGLMQINSSHLPLLKKHGLYDPRRIYEPEYNFKVGAWLLRQCVNQFGQSWKSIDCYNKGPRKAQESSKYIDRFIQAYRTVPFEKFTRLSLKNDESLVKSKQ